ncbi:cation:proton antiporter [Uliginosibacterium sp. sgz301328]|uniref:cation:proton antiporter n=1 Tax=Uliginosibacterium sp. sgz301328 TaxID=3243764 RepID=UPI00359EE4EC
MHAIDFIQDLAVVMLVAGVVTVLFHRFRQPVVLGYIVAGVIIGPYTPPFQLIKDEHTIQTLAELGVVFLLFSLGLEFSIRKLFRVGAAALAGALAEIALMMWVGYEIGMFFDWGTMNSIFLGAMLAVSSTTIIIKALNDLGYKNEQFAQVVFGILIVEDILAIAMIVLLSAIATTGAVSTGAVFATLGKLSLFMVVSLVLGILIVPRLLSYVASFNNNEMLLVTVLGLCFAFCLLVVKLEYSLALGAFVIGAIMAEARELHTVERLIEPVRDMFSAIFFVAIGLLLDPRILVEYWEPVAIITVAVVIGKVISCGLGAFAAGQDGRTSLRIGMSLSQIGEFSFIIASLGVSLKVTSGFLYPVAVAVSAVTALLTPYLIRLADPLSLHLARAMPRRVAQFANAYTEKLRAMRPEGERAMLARIIQRILLQIGINFSLVVAVFLAAAFLIDGGRRYVTPWISDVDVQNTIVWGLALIASVPFLLAGYGKLKALGMLLAEMIIGPHAGRLLLFFRRLVAESVPIVVSLLVFVAIVAVSADIQPPMTWMALTLGVVAVLTWLLYEQFTKLHFRFKIALIDTFDNAQH